MRIAFHVFIPALLVEGLGFEQIVHGASSRLVIVRLKTQVLAGLSDAFHGYLHLFIGIAHGVPRVLHVDDEQFATVAQVVFIVAHRQAGALISGKPLFYEGELYSEEHKRKFKTERAGFQVVKNPKDKSKLALAINGQPIGKWFKEQFGRQFSSVKRTVEPLRKGKGMGL